MFSDSFYAPHSLDLACPRHTILPYLAYMLHFGIGTSYETHEHSFKTTYTFILRMMTGLRHSF